MDILGCIGVDLRLFNSSHFQISLWVLLPFFSETVFGGVERLQGLSLPFGQEYFEPQYSHMHIYHHRSAHHYATGATGAGSINQAVADQGKHEDMARFTLEFATVLAHAIS